MRNISGEKTVRLATMLAVFLLIPRLSGVAEGATVAANTTLPIASTPPMGFNNWARFQCQAQAPINGRPGASYGFQDFMLDQASALVATGLSDAGYRTLVVDDCWMGERGKDGVLHGISHWGSFRHPTAQPGFNNELSAYVGALHAKGLKAGLYNTAGTTTCQRVAAGEQGHQSEDAKHYAQWGVDFLKLDNCGAADGELPGLFRQMGSALGAATAHNDRKILFDESAPAQYAPTDPMKYEAMEWVRPLGQMWRVGPDIRITHTAPDGSALYDPWNFDDADQGYEEGVYQSFTDTVALSRYVGPGNWNDADQLLLGDSGMSSAEERSQLGLWSVMAAPLMISADLRLLARDPHDARAAATLATLTNRRVLDVDQDSLGAGGYLVMHDHSANDVGIDVVLKPLADGGFATLILNKNPIAADVSIPFTQLGVEQRSCPLDVTELWSGTTQTLDARSALGGRIAPHDNLLFRVKAASCLAWSPSGQINTAQARFAAPPLCLESGDDKKITAESCSAGVAQRWEMTSDGHIRSGTGSCLTGGNGSGGLMIAACLSSPQQHFRYHRSGAIMTAGGQCLTMDTGKVGNGGLIGQQGAALRLSECRKFAPEQTFSAPHAGQVPT
jgi:alpha-galactosidase